MSQQRYIKIQFIFVITTVKSRFSSNLCHNNSKFRFSSHLCCIPLDSVYICVNIYISKFSSQFHNNSTSRFSSHFCHKNSTSSQMELFLAPATCHDSSTELLQLLTMVKTHHVRQNSPSYSPCLTELPQPLTMSDRTPPATHHVRQNFPSHSP